MHAGPPPALASSPPALLATLLCVSLTACPAAPERDAERAKPETAAQPSGPAKPPFPPATSAAHSGPEFVKAPAEGNLFALISEQQRKAEEDNRQLVVYVGASWCEPCRYFHGAVEDGSLDQAFPRLRLLEFDLDRDRDRLVEAGYHSKLIPLFALPGRGGRPSGKSIEGGVKGPDGVAHITRRLEGLLLAAEQGAVSGG